ncbi:MAG: hypothetical protein M0R47_01530 [Methylobacter sp.]|uniref:hypothetical protein n=1 Tax=Methylobacter sp. TaxID=2051955 RepID=UPI0025F16C73|nr:hypothetical protein [Methylobacter sp.]MCK9619196.1 hypothetical protein [Methylobacter sp.]
MNCPAMRRWSDAIGIKSVAPDYCCLCNDAEQCIAATWDRKMLTAGAQGLDV